MSRVKRFVRTEIVLGVRHLRENAMRLLVIAVAAFALSHGLIIAVRGRLAQKRNLTRHATDGQLVPGPWGGRVALEPAGTVWLAARAGRAIHYPVLVSMISIPAALLARVGRS